MDYTTTTYTPGIGQQFTASLQNVFYTFLLFLPKLVAAIIIFIVGYVLAVVLAKVVRRIVAFSRIDRVVQDVETHSHLRSAGIHFIPSVVLGVITKWLVMIATLVTIAGVLNLQQINLFLNQLLLYIPNILVAIVIVTVGFIVGDFLERLVKGMQFSSISLGDKQVISLVAKYGTVIFAITAALVQLKIATSLIQMLFGGLVLTLTLAFGLGGREHAAKLLDKVYPR